MTRRQDLEAYLPELDSDEDAPSTDDITNLLNAWGRGEPQAADELVRRLWGRLERLASSFIRQERQEHTLQTTALINEAYLRLVQQEKSSWEDREQFLALIGRMMRRILVDHARRRSFAKHGGLMKRVSEEALERKKAATKDGELVALDSALDALNAEHSDWAKVVELRYFVGLTGQEIAAVLDISTPTVQRRWQMAKAWLYRHMRSENENESGQTVS